MDNPITLYLAELRLELRGNPVLARRVLDDALEHLSESAAALRSTGMTPHDAEAEAVRRMGPASRLVQSLRPLDLPFRTLLAVWSILTAGMSLWLVSVILVVLPRRDPDHIPMWSAITVGFAAYSLLSWVFLLRHLRGPWLRRLVLVASLGVIAFGAYCVVTTILAMADGTHFEGYLLLMGVVLCAHGLTAIVCNWLSSGIAGRIRAT